MKIKKLQSLAIVLLALVCVAVLASCKKKPQPRQMSPELETELLQIEKELNSDSTMLAFFKSVSHFVEADTLFLAFEINGEAHDTIAYADTAEIKAMALQMLVYSLPIYQIHADSLSFGVEYRLSDINWKRHAVVPFAMIDTIIKMNEADNVALEDEELPYTAEEFVNLDWRASIDTINNRLYGGELPGPIDEVTTLQKVEVNGKECLIYFLVDVDQDVDQEYVEQQFRPSSAEVLAVQYAAIGQKLVDASVQFRIVHHSTISNKDLINIVIPAKELF